MPKGSLYKGQESRWLHPFKIKKGKGYRVKKESSTVLYLGS